MNSKGTFFLAPTLQNFLLITKRDVQLMRNDNRFAIATSAFSRTFTILIIMLIYQGNEFNSSDQKSVLFQFNEKREWTSDWKARSWRLYDEISKKKKNRIIWSTINSKSALFKYKSTDLSRIEMDLFYFFFLFFFLSTTAFGSIDIVEIRYARFVWRNKRAVFIDLRPYQFPVKLHPPPRIWNKRSPRNNQLFLFIFNKGRLIRTKTNAKLIFFFYYATRHFSCRRF